MHVVRFVLSTSGMHSELFSVRISSGRLRHQHHHKGVLFFLNKTRKGLIKGKKCISSYRFCIFYKHHYTSSSCYPETMRFPGRFASSDWSDLKGGGAPIGRVQFKFIQACGSHCTHPVHLQRSWANLHHNPAPGAHVPRRSWRGRGVAAAPS